MTSIWGFFVQTLTVSMVAAMLLAIKQLLNDKLSPRWQYGIWSVLAIRMLVPVFVNRSLLLPIPVWVEVIKSSVEKNLHSAYAESYFPTKIQHVLPILKTKPESITDWLFVAYVFGIFVTSLWYLISYLRLRRLLFKGCEPTEEIKDKVLHVCEIYQLKACKIVVIKGITTAFVCGGIRPILALPYGKEVDEKVLLHELLHLKYHDELQSMGWCLFRCLHWCNPFLQYVFHRVENDMEALCDQRVLERLQGEERRVYGLILLEMANERYARVPGTSSISNGGKNISRRIDAIVRFKKYPRGMALVSVCIGIVLLFPTLWGTSYAYHEKDYRIRDVAELEYAMAVARLHRCETVAGALDTYAKGLMLENGLYIATASSFDKHEALMEEMMENEDTGEKARYLSSKKGFEYLVYPENYRIYNLEKVQEDCYKAYLAFRVSGFDNEEGIYCTVANGACLIVPVIVKYEDAWVVEEQGDRIEALHSLEEASYPDSAIPYLKQYKATGKTGTVEVGFRTYCYVDNNVPNSQQNLWGGTSMDESLKTKAEFAYGHMWEFLEYSYAEDEQGRAPQETFGIHSVRVDSLEEEVEFENGDMTGHSSGSSTDGNNWGSTTVEEGNNTYMTGGGMSIDPAEYEGWYPKAYKVGVYWDDKLVEELVATETAETGEKGDKFLVPSKAVNQTAEYMSAESKQELKRVKDQEYKAVRAYTQQEIDQLIENYMFSAYDKSMTSLETLEECGIYLLETYGSAYPDIYVSSAEIMEPLVFYNANDETWIVVCAGFCRDENWKSQTLAGDVGTRDSWGVRFVDTNGKYETHVVRVRAFIEDESEERRVETENRSEIAEGFGFELQDYTYRKTPLAGELQYVGHKWYGACIYAPGFEELSGDLVVYYNHTN